ncbi:galanin-like peptide [Macrotis lagotis]|uniref:galanin-like peptide n=1 Tax=Macrotis lagotis TaxID=92651 RepID=UPI003D694BDC
MVTATPPIVLFLLLNLPWAPEAAPGHRIHGEWTLNSAGYLLGPVIHLPPYSRGSHWTPRREALEDELTASWEAKNGLLLSQPHDDPPRRNLGKVLPQPERRAWLS